MQNGGSNETADKLHLPIAKEAGGSAKEPDPYRNLGTIGYSLNFNEYVDYQKSQLAYAKKMNNKEGEAEAYDNLGDAYQSVGDYKQAIVYYNLELAISKELGNRVREGSTYRVLGNAYERLSDFKRAVDCHNLQLSIARETGDRRSEGNAYCNLGNVYQHLGDFKQAIDYHKLHLNISKETGDKTGEGGAYGNLGNAYQSLGEFKEAKAHHELDLAIAKEIGDRVGEGRALGNLGSALRSLGDFRKAIYHQKLRLAIAKEVGDWRGEGRAYGNLGNVYRSLGDFKQAIYYHKLHRDIAKSLGDRAGEGYACGHLGSAFYCLGDFRQAIDYHKMHLAISKDVGDRAGEGYAYGNLGISYQSLDDLEQAIHYYKLTLEITKEVRNKAGEGRIYGYLGSAYRTLHDVTRAIGFQRLRLAIANDVGDVEEVAGAYYGLGSCFEDQGALIEAQDCYETSVRHLNGIRRLLQSHDEWKIGLRDVYQFAYTSLWAVLLKRNKPLEALRAAEQGRAQALVELMESQYGFEPSQSGREDGVDFSNLGFLSSSTIFLALGSSALNTWVVTNGNRIHFSKEEVDKGNVTKSCQSFMESIKKAILAAAKCEDRSLDALRDAIYDLSVNESLIKASPESESPEIHLQILYDLIIRPVADQLCGDEVIIVPDGTLFLAPYAAFVDSNGKYLCESYRIRVLPSLTSLKLITEAPSDYHCNSGALIVGNPCTKEIRNDKGAAFLPLPAAEKEATMIAQILNTSPLIGSQATKAKVIERLNSVALIHIAAHGDIKTGEIALAPNPRRRSSTPKWEDFVLTMNDLLRLRLRARLVVLSCCHSGRGEIKAEGVVGIARAFLGAGARSVLVSLWAIDDEATLEFMTGFYQQLVHGVRASNALNQAMKCLRESKRFNDVRYWAPFVLIGDDVTLKPGGAER